MTAVQLTALVLSAITQHRPRRILLTPSDLCATIALRSPSSLPSFLWAASLPGFVRSRAREFARPENRPASGAVRRGGSPRRDAPRLYPARPGYERRRAYPFPRHGPAVLAAGGRATRRPRAGPGLRLPRPR